MYTEKEIKDIVREKYAEIAGQDRATNAASCCGVGTPGTYTIMSESYAGLEGYTPDADLGLGCGLPTEYARIQPGDVVLDLGSGAGNDAFVARAETGETGKVIGVDFTPAMIRKARENAEKLGYNNVEFREGDIEDLPISDNSVDVVISNCVLNLVPNKAKAFAEILRVLRPGGHFSISDVVLTGALPPQLQAAAEMYAGCVAGAILRDEYMALIEQAGFEHIKIEKQKPILIPDSILQEYLSAAEIENFRQNPVGIFSITVYGQKPGGSAERRTERAAKPKIALRDLVKGSTCCSPNSGCC
ncbi:MAG: arsenite methyltransferase [Saprospiraceae bacterium]|nr:arsenite methyltransferase [Saprospiraceae bacterium]MDW8230589.1 arsenite methyltransferase [Saprospiraceae bacterium]